MPYGQEHRDLLNEYVAVNEKSTDIAMSSWFENLALLVIVLNALWIGVEVDINDSGTSQTPFFVVENIFCVLFTAEIVIRLLSYKKPSYFCTDKELRFWNVFDMALVLFSPSCRNLLLFPTPSTLT